MDAISPQIERLGNESKRAGSGYRAASRSPCAHFPCKRDCGTQPFDQRSDLG